MPLTAFGFIPTAGWLDWLVRLEVEGVGEGGIVSFCLGVGFVSVVVVVGVPHTPPTTTTQRN
jgi:hypothetical protein